MFNRALFLFSFAAVLPLLPSQGLQPSAELSDSRFAGARDEFDQEIFFAVLEGLYRDGVSTEVVEKILVTDEVTGYPANFIWCCPICMPALDAFNLYRARPRFVAIKTYKDTFGEGLSAEVIARLENPVMQVRQGAIRELVESWVRQRVDSQNLTYDERLRFEENMRMRRKQGMEFLHSYQEQGLGGSYVEMNDCAFCDGANDAFGG